MQLCEETEGLSWKYVLRGKCPFRDGHSGLHGPEEGATGIKVVQNPNPLLNKVVVVLRKPGLFRIDETIKKINKELRNVYLKYSKNINFGHLSVCAVLFL